MGSPPKRKITQISVQKKNPHRRSVFLDGEFAFGLNEEIVAKYDLQVDSQLEDADLLEILQKEETLKAKDAALNYLSVRARSRKEIVDKLTQKGYDKDIVAQVTDDLEEVGLVNDSEFSRAWVKERLHIRPRGRRMLGQELWQKGIAKEVAEKAIQEAFEKVDEGQLAIELLKKRLSRYQGLDKNKAKRRMTDFLLRRGFDWETVKEALTAIWEEKEIDEN
jgi:regulatory protein